MFRQQWREEAETEKQVWLQLLLLQLEAMGAAAANIAA